MAQQSLFLRTFKQHFSPLESASSGLFLSGDNLRIKLLLDSNLIRTRSRQDTGLTLSIGFQSNAFDVSTSIQLQAGFFHNVLVTPRF